MEYLSIEKEGPVAVMAWKNEKENQFTTPFMKEILAGLQKLAKDKKVRGVVITSALKKYFSTGLHLEWILSQGAKDPKLIKEYLEILHKFIINLTAFPKPLIAAINGHAVAAGAIMCACMDFRLMREDKGLVALPEVQIDIPFWPGMTAIFKDILPSGSFRDLAYTGDKFTSEQAMDLGFVDMLCPKDELLPVAIKLAHKLGQANPETYAAIKLGLRRNVLDIMKKEDPKAIKEFMDRVKKASA